MEWLIRKQQRAKMILICILNSVFAHPGLRFHSQTEYCKLDGRVRGGCGEISSWFFSRVGSGAQKIENS